MNGSIIAEDDQQKIEEETINENIINSFIDMNILKELQRELHLLDVENEFDVKVKRYYFNIRNNKSKLNYIIE